MKNLKYYLNKALKENFAIGAFNFTNMESLKAICEAAKANNSPAIIAVSESAMSYMGEEFLISIAEAAKKKYKAPIFLHLDHGKTYEICKKALSLGFDSVMIDGSSLPFKDNIALTKKVSNLAHKSGKLCEGEIGVLAGIEDAVSSNKNIFTDPLEAKEFVEKTGVDMLAVAIGTSHGAYKFKGDAKLRFDILKQIEKLLPKTPLVLHGASSVDKAWVELAVKYGADISSAKGIPDSALKTACTKHNIAKVNTDTDLRIANTAKIRELLSENPKEIDPRKYLSKGQYGMFEVVSMKMKNTFKSAGKA